MMTEECGWSSFPEAMESLYNSWYDNFSYFRSYLEYEVLGESGIIDSNRANSSRGLPLFPMLCTLSHLNGNSAYGDYAFIAVIEYGKNGNVISTSFLTHEKNNASQVLNEIAKEKSN